MSGTRAMCHVDVSLCNLCGLCVEACPCHSLEMGEQGLVFHCPERCDPELMARCLGCGCLCEEVCPIGAVTCEFDIVLDSQDGGL